MPQPDPTRKMLAPEALAARLDGLRRAGKTVVFTNGCFDLLHVGHVHTLTQAKACGDVLVVAVNSDASVRRLKGASRPIVDQHGRMTLLAALEAVDYVAVFDDDTPLALIRRLRPHVLVKGGDWQPDEIVGKAVVERDGGRVVTVPYREGSSTTRLIERILAAEKRA